MVYDAIAKIMLHQLRERFKTLSFPKRMELYPDIFKELFEGSDIGKSGEGESGVH